MHSYVRSLVKSLIFLQILSLPALAAPQKEWTFLIFMNGNNNLDNYGTMDLNEMEKIGSTSDVNVVVQWASLKAGPTRRVYVQKDENPSSVTSPIVETIGNVDMGDWRQLVEFVRWGVEHYPAKRYFINVWNHGSGWHLKNATSFDGGFRATDISYDDRTGNHITTEQLGQAMSESARIMGHKVDIYGSDACLMGMVEVAGEMADSVSTFVGAEEVEPLPGWPYDTFLARWVANPRASNNEISRALVEEFVKSYRGGTQGTEEVTLSAYDMAALPDVVRSITSLGGELKRISAAAKRSVLDQASSAQKFTYGDYSDLLDFVGLIDNARVPGIDRGTLTSIRTAVGRFVVANGTTPNYAKATGLAIWLPTSKSSYDWYANRYRALKFGVASSWHEALASLYANP